MNTRQLAILNLFLQDGGYRTAKALSQEFAVSAKTIYKDVLHINAFLQTYHVCITSTPSQGLRLLLSDEGRRAIRASLSERNDRRNEAEGREELLCRELIRSVTNPFNCLYSRGWSSWYVTWSVFSFCSLVALLSILRSTSAPSSVNFLHQSAG